MSRLAFFLAPNFKTLAAYVWAVVWLGIPLTIFAERSVTLAWDPSSSSSVAGYYVYAWEENAATPIKLNVGSMSYASINGLKEGLRYTFQVTAYNPYGLESPPSAGLPYVVPVPLRMTPPDTLSSACRIQFPAAPGKWYELQASTDMVNWTTIWQTGLANNYSWVEYQDPRSRYYSNRFYRLQVH